MKHVFPAAIRATAILAVALLVPRPSPAQSDSWERVRLIEPGKGVHVRLLSGKTVKGKMESWSGEGLRLRQSRGNVVPVSKSDVQRVSFVAGMSRGRRAAWAALIGGGGGFALGAGVCGGSGDCDYHPAAIGAGTALWVGGISAGIAALIPQHKETVYIIRAPSGAARGN